MKERTTLFIDQFFVHHPEFLPLQDPILKACHMLIHAFQNGNKLLLCGNGGSCADCDHIAGELLKGFLLKRPVCSELKDAMQANYGDPGAQIAQKLQVGLPVISLVTHGAAISAFSNDVDPELIYAQQVLAYGKPGDILMGISTSGNAKNVDAAVMTAAAMGLHTIGLTGKDGGILAQHAELPLVMPEKDTYLIQENHICVYHLICAVVESELFDT